MKPRPWISAHVFYSADQDRLLTEVVGPLVEQLRNEGRLKRFFFVRYRLGGPHLRLRIQPAEADETELERIRHRLAGEVQEHLRRNPSSTELPLSEGEEWDEYYRKWDHDTDPWSGPRPNDSVIFTQYEPETTRYGGPDRIPEFEIHFERSSLLSLKLISAYRPDLRTHLALKLLLSLPRALGYSLEQTTAFFHCYSGFWLDNLPKGLEEAQVRRGLEDRYQGLEGLFLSSLDPGDLPLFSFWGLLWQHAESLVSSLTCFDEEHKLQLRVGLVHLFMNRLGLAPLTEALLAYGCFRMMSTTEVS